MRIKGACLKCPGGEGGGKEQPNQVIWKSSFCGKVQLRRILEPSFNNYPRTDRHISGQTYCIGPGGCLSSARGVSRTLGAGMLQMSLEVCACRQTSRSIQMASSIRCISYANHSYEYASVSLQFLHSFFIINSRDAW